MFIAMNRFNVKKNRTEDFESMWKNRDSFLSEMEGFQSFSLLKGPEYDDYILYSSHTVWANKNDFKAWTQSEAFRKAHANAGNSGEPATIGRPVFEEFEAILTEPAK